uniref:Uncharacterized protein n=1 Tax=Avena sativa TaxID=4498 RepID=A0ACD5VDG1_AVESA
MSGNQPGSNGAGDTYARDQYSFSSRILLTAAVILFSLTFVFVVSRILMRALMIRSGEGGTGTDRRGSLAAGFMRSISRMSSSRRGLDASALSALPVTAYRKEVVAGAGAGGADCAVCLSELADGDKVRELPNCGHAFHVECVDAWLRTRTTCPLCRAGVELPQGNGNGNGKAEAAAQPSASSSATVPLPQPALFGAGETLIVTVDGAPGRR